MKTSFCQKSNRGYAPRKLRPLATGTTCRPTIRCSRTAITGAFGTHGAGYRPWTMMSLATLLSLKRATQQCAYGSNARNCGLEASISLQRCRFYSITRILRFFLGLQSRPCLIHQGRIFHDVSKGLKSPSQFVLISRPYARATPVATVKSHSHCQMRSCGSNGDAMMRAWTSNSSTLMPFGFIRNRLPSLRQTSYSPKTTH